MFDYDAEIVEENKELIDKYVFETKLNNIHAVKYYIGRDYTFGYDYINVLFASKFSALVFLMKHKDQCEPKK